MIGPSTSPETDQPVYTQAQLDACVAQARADGIEEGRGDMEHLERKWRADERLRVLRDVVGHLHRNDLRGEETRYIRLLLDAAERGVMMSG